MSQRLRGGSRPRFSNVEEVLEDIRRGRPVIVVKDEDSPAADGVPEFIVVAAEFATPETINFMVSLGRGMLYLGLTPERCDELRLKPLSQVSSSWTRKLMTSVDGRDVSGVGISSADRALTIRVAIDGSAGPEQLVRPGHVYPLQAEEGGSLVRAGQTEAAVDLARLAGLVPAAVMSELLNEDGEVADADRLAEVATTHGLKLVSIAALVAYRRSNESIVEEIASARLPTLAGDFTMVGFQDRISDVHHLALVKGDVRDEPPPLVAVEFECLLGDAFRSNRCQCRPRMQEAMDRIAGDSRGVLLHLSRLAAPISGEPMLTSCQEYVDQPAAAAIDADGPLPWGHVEIASALIKSLGLARVRLLTTLPMTTESFLERGITVTERVPYPGEML